MPERPARSCSSFFSSPRVILALALLSGFPRSAASQAGQPAPPAAAVELDGRLIALPADPDAFPSGREFPDRAHEGAVTICVQVATTAGRRILLLEDQDMGLGYVTMTSDTATWRGCPESPARLRLRYRGVAVDFGTSLALLRRRFGAPVVSGDTLRWEFHTRRTEWPDGRRGAPVRIYVDAGLELVQRNGETIAIAVWCWEETE